jgi:four helix bundle protein
VSRIEQFEDIDSWKLGRELTREIYRITSEGNFARDFEPRNQIRRAAVSILSNIAEGFERTGNREFVQFLSMAKGSCGELRAQLYVALDQNYITSAQFEALSQQARSVSQLTSGLIRYLQQSELRGSKFKTVPNLER